MTGSDRELLMLAAKAYWREEVEDLACSFRWSEEDQEIAYIHGDNQDHNGHDQEFLWNSLKDDGDALRLANKLSMSVEICDYEETTYAYAGPCPRVHSWESWRQDKDAATRRAITRAAAEIGKAIA